MCITLQEAYLSVKSLYESERWAIRTCLEDKDEWLFCFGHREPRALAPGDWYSPIAVSKKNGVATRLVDRYEGGFMKMYMSLDEEDKYTEVDISALSAPETLIPHAVAV